MESSISISTIPILVGRTDVYKRQLEDNAQAKWPHIDEKYFEEAAVYYKIPAYRARNNEKAR